MSIKRIWESGGDSRDKKLTTATAGEASNSGTLITVKYEMLTNKYRTVTKGIPIIIDLGRFL